MAPLEGALTRLSTWHDIFLFNALRLFLPLPRITSTPHPPRGCRWTSWNVERTLVASVGMQSTDPSIKQDSSMTEFFFACSFFLLTSSIFFCLFCFSLFQSTHPTHRQPLFVREHVLRFVQRTSHFIKFHLVLIYFSLSSYTTLHALCIKLSPLFSPVLWLCCMRYQHSEVILIAR